MSRRNGITVLIVCAFALAVFPLYAAGPAALVKRTFLPGDQHRTILTISEPCTVVVSCKSSLGAGLKIEDRLTGQIGSSGNPGTADGRLDLTLDIGEYRVTVERGENDGGPIELSAVPLTEKNGRTEMGALLNAVPGKTYETTLGDGERRSFWISYPGKASPFTVSAAGRNLSGVQLWKDGQLLVPLSPYTSQIDPEGGRSLSYVELDLAALENGGLDAGDYLIVFTGGLPRVWEREEKRNPLYIRAKETELGSAWVGTVTIGPLGFEAYSCAAWNGALAEVVPVDGEIQGIRGGETSDPSPQYKWDYSDYAEWDEEESSYPGLYLYGDESWIRVFGAPGTTAELRLVPEREAVYIEDTYPFLATAIPSAAQTDSVDLTGAYIDDNGIIAERSVELSGKKPIVRETGIFSVQNMLVRVAERGTYRIYEDETAGGQAEYSFTRISQGTDPVYADKDGTFLLEADLYLFTIEMYDEDAGLLRFALIKTGFLSFSDIRAKGFFSKNIGAPVEGFTISGQASDPYDDPVVTLGTDGCYPAGIVMYSLPLSDTAPVMIWLAAGESLTIPSEAAFTARSARGRTTVSTAGSTSRQLVVKNTGTAADFVILERAGGAAGSGGASGAAAISLPAPPSLLTTLPRIEQGKPVYNDYEKNQTRVFLVSVATPGYYTLETTGRLNTELTVRTFVRPSLFTGSTGGSGRNARLAAYLPKGIYIAQVRTTGGSAGRAGLRLEPVPEIEGGILVPGQILRSFMPGGAGLAFTLENPETAPLSIRAESLGSSHRLRITDSEGWLAAEGTDISLEFEGPASYRVFSLPADSAHRRRIRVVSAPEKPVLGDPEKETVALPFGTSFNGRWNERDPREPHRFSFTVPSAGDFTLRLSREMSYVLARGTEQVAAGDGKQETLSLPAGEYILSVTAREKENDRPYSLMLWTSWLMPGIPQSVSGQNGTLTVSIPEEGIYDIESVSSKDLTAALVDQEGRTIASSDDRRFDWDFSISAPMKPGRYELRFSSIYGSRGTAEISVTPRNVRDLGMVTLPLERTWPAEREVLLLSFRPERSGVYRISARNSAVEKIDLLREGSLLASGFERIYIPLEMGKEYRLSIPVTSTRKTEIPVSIAPLTGAQWNLGRSPKAEGTGPFSLSGGSRFSYAFTGDHAVLYSPGIEQPMEPAGRYPQAVPQDGGWIMLVDGSGSPAAGKVTASAASADGRGFATIIGSASAGFLVSGSADAVTVCRVTTPDAVMGVALAAGTPPNMQAPVSTAETFAWVAGESVAAICAGGTIAGSAWNADPDQGAAGGTGAAAAGVAAGITAESYPVEQTLSWNPDMTVQVQPGSAVRIEAPRSPASVSIIASAGVIFLDQSEKRSRTYWNPDGNIEERTLLGGTVFYAVNTTTNPGLLRITPAVPRTVLELDANDTWSGVLPGSGAMGAEETLVRIGTAAAYLVFGEELTEPPVLFGSDGTIRRAAEIEPGVFRSEGSDGILSLRGAGLVRVQKYTQETAWDHLIASPDRNRFERWKKAKDSTWMEGIPVLKPGSNMGEGWFLLSLKEAALVTLKTQTGGYLAIYGTERIGAFRAENLTLTAYLDTEPVLVYWKPQPGTRELFLEARVPAEFPTAQVPCFLGSGEEAVYRFTVTEETAVGITARAEREVLEISLFDRSFRMIASGPVIYRTLPPGEYVAVMRGSDAPVRYVPLIYGNDGSKRDVPDEIKKGYREE